MEVGSRRLVEAQGPSRNSSRFGCTEGSHAGNVRFRIGSCHIVIRKVAHRSQMLETCLRIVHHTFSLRPIAHVAVKYRMGVPISLACLTPSDPEFGHRPGSLLIIKLLVYGPESNV